MSLDPFSLALGAVLCIVLQWLYALFDIGRAVLVFSGKRRLADLMTNALLVALLVTVVAWVVYEMWSALKLIALNVRGR